MSDSQKDLDKLQKSLDEFGGSLKSAIDICEKLGDCLREAIKIIRK